jgi:hypothetical protein
MAAPLDAWSSDWAELRKQNRWTWFSFFGLIALLLAAHGLGLPELAIMMLGAPLLVYIFVLTWRMSRFQCPRCGEKFFHKRWGPFQNQSAFRWDCIHCGLQKFTPSYKAKPFNKITDNWDRLF